GGVCRSLRDAPYLRPGREADRGQDPGHLARLRQRRRRRRDAVSVHLPDRGHLLVARHRRGGLREEAAGRQPQGQEDRVHLLRPPERPRAARTREKKSPHIFAPPGAGGEPIEVIQDLAGREGFQLKEFAVPPPGVEMGAQVLDIAQRYRADFVIAHLFGGAPAVSIKELKRVGYPLKKVVSFVWGSAEANIEAAGGFQVAEGYYTMQCAGVGTDYPVLNEIREMYKKEGKPAPKEMASTVFYNLGVLIGALHVEGIRHD